MDLRNLTGKTALVTGAASGIGKATALAFAERGANLVICDVNESGLGEIEQEIRARGRAVLARQVDVADRDQMAAFASTVHREIDAVDLLMNNAGVAVGGGLLHTELGDWDWVLGINVLGVVHGCHFFVPQMVERRGGGHVINVASAAGYFASEGLAAYSTTKFAVVGLSEALRDELRRYGIGVTAVCPGFVATRIIETARLRGPDAAPGIRRRVIEMYERRNYTPERVALNILHAVQRNRAVAPITIEAWVFYYWKRLAPGLLARVGSFMAKRTREKLLAP